MDTKNWVKWFKPLLFPVAEIPQTATEDSQFKLVCYCKPHGVLDFIMVNWKKELTCSSNEFQHALDLRAHIEPPNPGEFATGTKTSIPSV